MSPMTALRLNMTNVANPTARHADRYRAALDMAEYADSHGFTAVSVEEYHLAVTGWLPSPLILAAAIAGRTRNVRISINALIVLTPKQLVDEIRRGRKEVVINPLVGGLPLDAGWASQHCWRSRCCPR